MRYAQIIMGLKGSGKSTYCKMIAKYAESKGRKMRIINMDPNAKSLAYETPIADVRDVVKLEEVQEADRLAPGTGAGFELTLSYVVDHPDWLFESVGEVTEGDYLLFDCPGEEEYHAHLKSMKVFAAMLVVKNFRTCGVFVRDSRHALNGYSFIASCLTPLTSYVNLSIPHVCLMMKIDLLTDEEKARLLLFINSDIKDVLRYENSRTKSLALMNSSMHSGGILSNSGISSSGVIMGGGIDNSGGVISGGIMDNNGISSSSSNSNESNGSNGAGSSGIVENITSSTTESYQELAKICTTAANIIEGHNLVRKKYYPLDIREDLSLKGFLAILDDIMGISED